MEQLLSIIIIGNENIQTTIESLEEQVYSDIEIILSEKNSEIEKKSNIKFVDNEDIYINEDKNILNSNMLKHVSGKYFTILNSGDTVGIDFYRILMENIETLDTDAIAGNIVYEKNQKRVTYDLLDSSIPKDIESEKINELLDNNSKLSDWLLCFGNKIVKKNSIENTIKSEINMKNILLNINNMKYIEADALFHKLTHSEIKGIEKNHLYDAITDWDYGIEEIKRQILQEEIKYVSFDVFDTLILRPFLEPRDLAYFMNDTLNAHYLNGMGMDFTNIRNESEIYARSKSNEQDITFDEIYDAMAELYGIEENVINELKQKEVELELKYCYKRKTGFELYEFAKFLNKDVIIVSDMYLPESIIKSILDKNGYKDITKYYVSSEYKLTKASGDIYDVVVKDLNIKNNEIIHIGDNWNSDWNNSREKGWQSAFLPRTINLFQESNLGKMFFKSLPFYEDNIAATNFLTIRCMLAIVANRFFDNPWKRYDSNSNFNANLRSIGYYALGMNTYGYTRWLIEELIKDAKGYDKIVFMARDGYLPIKAYEKMRRVYGNLPKSEYFYVSRKSLIPIIFSADQEIDMYKLVGSINVFNHTPQDIIRYLDNIIKCDKKDIQDICKIIGIEEDEKFTKIYQFNLFLKLAREKLLDKEYADTFLSSLSKYMNNIFEGRACVFDIGYSARPELLLSKFCKKPIDTFFYNINEQSAYENARLGNFKIKTFMDYKPVITGSIREIFISKLGPSCIGYKLIDNKIEPVFEEYKINVDYKNIMEIMQNEALSFINDMIDIFGDELNKFDYYKYYTNLPLDVFINSSESKDKEILKVLDFEDDVGMGKKVSMTKYLSKERTKYNQWGYKRLIDCEKEIKENMNSNLGIVDLSGLSKIKKAVFYMLFRKDIFKRRMSEIKNKIPGVRKII